MGLQNELTGQVGPFVVVNLTRMGNGSRRPHFRWTGKLAFGRGPTFATFPRMKPASAAFALTGLLLFMTAPCVGAADRAHSEIESVFAEFVEADFPYFTQAMDTRKLGEDIAILPISLPKWS